LPREQTWSGTNVDGSKLVTREEKDEFGAPIEPDDAVLLCVHFQPKATARRVHYCDLPKGRMIDLHRQ